MNSSLSTLPPVKASSQAGIYAERAMQMMKALNVLPIPQHYSVFFAYAVGQPLALVKELDEAVKAKTHMDDAFLVQIYTRYIADPQSQAVHSTAFNARRVLNDMIRSVDAFDHQAVSISDQVNHQLHAMQAPLSEEQLRHAAQSLKQGAENLHSMSGQMATQLTQAQREIAELRENLLRSMTEAERDFLTGTYNRKAFDKRLNEAMLAAKADRSEMVLMLLSVDHFRGLIESFGHVIGDEVLKVVARTLMETLKGMDLVARYEGEQFAVILPQTPLSGGMAAAEHLRRNISSKELKRKGTGENFGMITVSVGVARLDVQEDSPSRLIARAGEALEQSKQRGYNRVTQAQASTD